MKNVYRRICSKDNIKGCNRQQCFSPWKSIYRNISSEYLKDVAQISAIEGVTTGRVEKTDPRSADYPLTPAPRTTLWTTPRTTLRTTPTDYPKKSTKFLLRSTKIQKAYLLFLHDHNCTKNSRHFLFLLFSTQSVKTTSFPGLFL